MRFFFVVFIETHWSGKRLKSCKKRIKCDEMTRKKWIKITKTFFFAFLTRNFLIKFANLT